MNHAAFTAGLRDALTGVGEWLAVHQPRLVAAVLLLLAGLALALLLRAAAARVARTLERMLPQRLLRRGLPQHTIERQVPDVIGLIVFWAVMLFFVAAAADALGLPVLSASLAGLGFYAPRLLAALLVVVFGFVVGNLARDGVTAAAAAAGTPAPVTLGQIARAAILVAVGLIAVAELGIDITLLTVLLAVILAAVLGAFALAFGLGARTMMSNIIGAHYLRKTFEAGQRVRVGPIEGVVTAITATAMVVRVADGEVVIPARQFSEQAAMVVTREEAR
jgi:small-conductance mechanosensitive channel